MANDLRLCRSEAGHSPHGSCPGKPYPPRLAALIGEAERLGAERVELARRHDAAKQAVLEERFSGWDRWQPGDVILARRELFGKVSMVPARVEDVHLHYSEGYMPETHRTDPGKFESSQAISYTVSYRRPGGSFSDKSAGVWHKQTAPIPEGGDSDGE